MYSTDTLTMTTSNLSFLGPIGMPGDKGLTGERGKDGERGPIGKLFSFLTLLQRLSI